MANASSGNARRRRRCDVSVCLFNVRRVRPTRCYRLNHAATRSIAACVCVCVNCTASAMRVARSKLAATLANTARPGELRCTCAYTSFYRRRHTHYTLYFRLHGVQMRCGDSKRPTTAHTHTHSAQNSKLTSLSASVSDHKLPTPTPGSLPICTRTRTQTRRVDASAVR